jgi:hypothetical protein
MGSPAVSADGISYVVAQATSVANNGTVSVMIALQMDKDVTLNLPEAYNPAYPVSVRQYNALTYPATGSDPVQTTTAILPANAVDNVVSSVQLNGELSHERIDVIGAVSQGIYDFEGLDISSRIELRSGWDYWIIYHTSVFIHLERDIALRLREVEEGGGEIDLCDAESAHIIIYTREHKAAIGGLCKNALISV